jgi:hypothetical protein
MILRESNDRPTNTYFLSITRSGQPSKTFSDTCGYTDYLNKIVTSNPPVSQLPLPVATNGPFPVTPSCWNSLFVCDLQSSYVNILICVLP